MELDKKQKDIIFNISNRHIYNISSYLSFYNLRTFKQYDKQRIQRNYELGLFEKERYFPIRSGKRVPFSLTEGEYNEKAKSLSIDPLKYEKMKINIGYSEGYQNVFFENTNYRIDLYKGIYISNSFKDILSFLTIWQYLKEEGYVLELNDVDVEHNIEAFFYEKDNPLAEIDNNNIEEYVDESISINDKYLLDTKLCLNNEYLLMCQKYINSRIYPTPSLKVFVQKGYKTSSERANNNALLVAILAVVVTIITSLTGKININVQPIVDLIQKIFNL